MEFLHLAMWHLHGSGIVTVNSTTGVGLPCNVTRGSGMTCHFISPNVRHTGFLLLVSILAISPQSTCHQSAKFYPNRTTLGRKKMTSCLFSRWRIFAILDFRGPIMGSLWSQCTTSYGSSIETIALNCLSFWENRVFCILATDRQPNRRTDKQARCLKPLSLSRAAA